MIVSNAVIPLISVLLPVYNVERYISQCLQSILNQTIKDFEVLIIDDCSTDNTLGIIALIPDSRIKIVKKTHNKGLIDSLNLGIHLATGRYIARMDGDDISATDRFAKQLKILVNDSSIKACGCWLQMFGSSDAIIRHKQYHNEIMVEMLELCSMSLGSVMFEKQWASKYPFYVSKKHYEDYDFWSRSAWDGKLYNIQEVLYFYRAHENQVSNLHNQMQRLGDVEVRLNLFKKIGYDSIHYDDEILKNVMLRNRFFEPADFQLFSDWLKNLKQTNKEVKLYEIDQFNKKLNQIKRKIIFDLFFRKSNIGIDKNWRKKVFFKLDASDFLFVIKLKVREYFKRYNPLFAIKN